MLSTNPPLPQPNVTLNTPVNNCAGSTNSETSHLKLWSNLAEIGELLNMPMPQAIYHENDHFQHLNYKMGQRIYTLEQKFDALYFVHSGFLKSVLFDEFGNEQVLNFPMRGDILGIDSIHTEHHNSEVVALSDCNVIVLPYKKLIELSHNHIHVEQTLFGLISKELAHQQVRLSMLGKTSAEARVAQFLVLLSDRFHSLGYSRNEFNLRMTRNEIGSYLGITLETVSRILSALNEQGTISVHQRKVQINNIDALKNLYTLTKSHNKQFN